MRASRLTHYWQVASTTVKRGTVGFWGAGLDFVYPPACLMCGCVVASETAPKFCPNCLSDLAPAIIDACERCGAPVGPNLDTTEGCIHCQTTPFHFDRAFALGVYKDLLKRACLTTKHHGTEPLATALAELLWMRERDRLESLNIDRVLSVPRHWTRRFWPGHNASETLARFFAKKLGAKCDLLRVAKTHRTPRQATLPYTRRLRNLQNAFALRRPSLVGGQNILIVDDVLTTATTVNRIARLLRKAGVRSIAIAVIARGLGGS